MSDHREIGRRHLFYYLEIDDAETGEMLGRLGDISRHGLLLLAEKPYEEGVKLNVRIRLPDDCNMLTGVRSEYLELTAETRWSRQDENPNVYSIGCEIMDVDEKNQVLIQTLINTIGFRDI